MFTILFATVLLVYIVTSVVIVYHLHTYTINKSQARQAIIAFAVIMVILIIAQVTMFFLIPSDIISGGALSPITPDGSFSNTFH